MDNAKIIQIAKRWDSEAKAWDSQAKRTNKGPCFDGDRRMRTAMAEVARQHAEQLREAVGSGAVLPDAPMVDVTALSSDKAQYMPVDQTDGE